MFHSKTHSRFLALMTAVAAFIRQAAAKGEAVSRTDALSALGGYRSRGKGQGGWSGRSPGNRCTNWQGASGQREALRRYRRAQGGPGLTLVSIASTAGPAGTWMPSRAAYPPIESR